MQISAIHTRYGAVCAVAGHNCLQADLELAAHATRHDQKELWNHYRAHKFSANELVFWLSVEELGGVSDHTADTLDRDLKKIIKALGLDEARRAYAKKLLTSDANAFTDVRYEIAVTAAAVDFFDHGSIGLEATIGGSAKNSDVKGTRNGAAVRLEVRVVHDDWPPRSEASTCPHALDRIPPEIRWNRSHG